MSPYRRPKPFDTVVKFEWCRRPGTDAFRSADNQCRIYKARAYFDEGIELSSPPSSSRPKIIIRTHMSPVLACRYIALLALIDRDVNGTCAIRQSQSDPPRLRRGMCRRAALLGASGSGRQVSPRTSVASPRTSVASNADAAPFRSRSATAQRSFTPLRQGLFKSRLRNAKGTVSHQISVRLNEDYFTPVIQAQMEAPRNVAEVHLHKCTVHSISRPES